jgi:hypothetical protein
MQALQAVCVSTNSVPAAQNLHECAAEILNSWNLPVSHALHAVLLSAAY